MQQEVNYRLGPCTAQKFPSLVEVLEPHGQAQVQGCPRDPSLSSHIRPSPDFPAQPVCNSPPRKSCFGTQGPIPGRRCVQPSRPGGSPRSGPTCQQKREREDGSGGGRAADRVQGTMGMGWTRDRCGTDAVHTRKQPDGVCPAPRSQTGFGQSAGDFKPLLRHKGHRNKMPVRRRGSAASKKGACTCWHVTQQEQARWAAAEISCVRGEK